MKILTISETDCGGKPTGFATIVPNCNSDTIKSAIVRGLMEAWYFNETMARMAVTEDVPQHVRESGYAYLSDDRFLVEVTALSIDPDTVKDTPVGKLLAASKAVMENYYGRTETLPFPYYRELGTAVAVMEAEINPF